MKSIVRVREGISHWDLWKRVLIFERLKIWRLGAFAHLNSLPGPSGRKSVYLQLEIPRVEAGECELASMNMSMLCIELQYQDQQHQAFQHMKVNVSSLICSSLNILIFTFMSWLQIWVQSYMGSNEFSAAYARQQLSMQVWCIYWHLTLFVATFLYMRKKRIM